MFRVVSGLGPATVPRAGRLAQWLARLVYSNGVDWTATGLTNACISVLSISGTTLFAGGWPRSLPFTRPWGKPDARLEWIRCRMAFLPFGRMSVSELVVVGLNSVANMPSEVAVGRNRIQVQPHLLTSFGMQKATPVSRRRRIWWRFLVPRRLQRPVGGGPAPVGAGQVDALPLGGTSHRVELPVRLPHVGQRVPPVSDFSKPPEADALRRVLKRHLLVQETAGGQWTLRVPLMRRWLRERM
jgi:hypothetical protein